MAPSFVLLVPLFLASVGKLSKRRLAILAVAVAICVPLAIFASIYILASSVEVSAHIISIHVVGSEEGALLLEAEVALNSTAPLDVGLEEAVADLLVNGSAVGEAELAEPVTLPAGRGTNVRVRARIWDLRSLGSLIANALSGREADLEARVRGKASALFFPIWFERRLEISVPLPALEFGELVQLVNVSFSSAPYATVLLTLKNPVDMAFELKQLNFSLRAHGLAVGVASLSGGPCELGAGESCSLTLDVAFREEAVDDVVAWLLRERAVAGEAIGTAVVGVAGAELVLKPLELPFDVEASMQMSAELIDVKADGPNMIATLEIGISAGLLHGPVSLRACSSLIYLNSSGGGFLGSFELLEPALLSLGGRSVVEVAFKPGPGEMELDIDLVRNSPLDVRLSNVSASISVLGVGPFDVSVPGPISSPIYMGISYNVSLSVMDLWPIEPGNVFNAVAQLNITMSSPVSSQVTIENATFELYNTTGHYLGNGSLSSPVVLPSANGNFSITMNSTFFLLRHVVGWAVQELLDEGSLELVLEHVEARVEVGPLSLEIRVPGVRYVYEPGEVSFDVTDVRLVEFDEEEDVVVFDVDISIYNPFSFVVNLSTGPNGEPPLSFEFWCQQHGVFLGHGSYEREAMILPRRETPLTVKVKLTPEGADHVLNPIYGHYRLWPPPPRIVLEAAIKDGVAFIRIYEVVVRVRFEEDGIWVNEPILSVASGSSVYACLEEVGHLHEGSPGLGAPQPFYSPLGLLGKPLHQPPGLLKRAGFDEDGTYLFELAWPYVGRAEELDQPGL